MIQIADLVRRLRSHSTHSLANASGLARQSIKRIKDGKTTELKHTTVQKLTAALSSLEKASGKAAPKRRDTSAARNRGAVSVGSKASATPKHRASSEGSRK